MLGLGRLEEWVEKDAGFEQLVWHLQATIPHPFLPADLVQYPSGKVAKRQLALLLFREERKGGNIPSSLGGRVAEHKQSLEDGNDGSNEDARADVGVGSCQEVAVTGEFDAGQV